MTGDVNLTHIRHAMLDLAGGYTCMGLDDCPACNINDTLAQLSAAEAVIQAARDSVEAGDARSDYFTRIALRDALAALEDGQ